MPQYISAASKGARGWGSRGDHTAVPYTPINETLDVASARATGWAP